MPKKSKRQKTLKINLPKLKCLSLIPDKLNAAKLTSQINETNENDIKLVENIKGNIFFYNT